MEKINTFQICCSACKVLFWLSDFHVAKLKLTHEKFYCPNGHSIYFPQKTDSDILRDELKEEKTRLQAALDELDMACSQLKELKKKIPKRDSSGKFVKNKNNR